jgi:hypothetical protein
VGDAAEGGDLLRGVEEARDEAEVLGDGQDGLPGEAVVEGDEGLGGGNVLCDGLLGEDVLAGGEGGLDVGRLGDDGERNDDGLDVAACEELRVGLAGRVLRVEVRGGAVCDLRRRLLR